ncbi:GAF domain-containing protein [Microbacterium sp. NPDC028030]|uniref:GAF domain-containing protein n=1 Tax=Microbacterium sp. NPDC028030 TaxID=3155124 RepID=UPI00340F6F00
MKTRSDQDPLWWTIVSVAVQVVGVFAASQLIAWAFREPEKNGLLKGVLFSGAAVVLIIAVGFAVTGKVREHARAKKVKSVREEQRTLLSDNLMPVAATIANMARLPHSARRTALRNVAQAGAGALSGIIDSEVSRARAVVYEIDMDSTPIRMVPIGHAGRGDRPRPFVARTERGDGAFDFIAALETAFYPDLTKEKPAGYKGTAQGYNTFISVPIYTETGTYGMVTLDALKADTLNNGHVALVKLLAETMSIAYEVGQDEDSADEDDDTGACPPPVVGSEA